jgi:cytochrome c biogenesis protein CcmG, thiol:disulfide interchange protein DsbE
VSSRTTPRVRRAAPPPQRASISVFWAAVVGVLVVALVVGLLVAVLGGDDGGSDKTEVADTVSVTGTALPLLTDPAADGAVGTPAPVVSGIDFDDQPVSTPAVGTPYAVVLVAHWCPHCQEEVPRIVSLADSGGTTGVEVLAVSTRTNEDAPNYPASEWLEREGWPFPVIVDDGVGSVATAYGLANFPTIVFVDAAGNVAARAVGEIPEADLASMFSALAAGQPVPVSGAAESSPG